MASTPPKPPDAFLSYTRFDNQHDGGAISEFCRRLASAVRAVTGLHFHIFQDVGGIGIGEHWRGKLDQMLDEARFFIPILTPSYFTSKPCRDELEKFLRAEAERERNDLVLPIYYIECEILEDDDLRAADPLAGTLHERQRQDWRELRFEPFDTAKVRRTLERLAREIVKARRRPIAPHQARHPGAMTPTAGRAKTSPPASSSERQKAEASSKFPPSPLTPGTVFRDIDAPWCPEMVVIPPGEFMMGSTEAERQWAVTHGTSREWVEREKPQHLVHIAYPLAVGRYPVTFEDYDHFARKKRRALPSDEDWGRAQRPVINVTWDDARAYVGWLAAETGQPYRLLSEAEWEYACRAGSTTRYWWGDEITRENANYGSNVRKTSEVGSYPASPFGLCDTHGNVWEWVEDCWHGSYDGARNDGSAWTAGNDSRRVLRGGSWSRNGGGVRSASRTGKKTDYRENKIGFRVTRTLSRSESATSLVQAGRKVERAQVSVSFRKFVEQLLIALSKKPGEISDLKRVAAANNIEYEEGWIARASEYLSTGQLASAKSRRHLQSGPDDGYYVVITGTGLAEAEKLQTHSGEILDAPSREAGARTSGVISARRRIFLAHAREDKLQVRQLYADLKARGLDPWLDEVDLMPGQIWKEEIPKAIRQAGVFLACLSSRSVGKVGYVHNEFRLALSQFGERPPGWIYLIPVRLNECVVPDLQISDRGLSLRDIHWVDLWEDGSFDRLVKAIEYALESARAQELTARSAPAEQLASRDAALRSILSSGTQAGIQPEPGTVFRDVDAPWCPELVVIPPGEFMMGSTEAERRWAVEQRAEPQWVENEKPQHPVRISHPLAVGRFPVTFEQYDRFARITRRDEPGDEGWGRGGRPVIKVSWEDAKVYVEWLAGETGQPYRLLSEAEWEYACRAGTTTRYWWGDEITPENANYGENIGRTSEVGSYRANPWGLYDTHGNVWEWVEDCWNDSYDSAPGDGSAWRSGDCSHRVLRGGSWHNQIWDLRSANRFAVGAGVWVNDFGFRIARTVAP